MKIDKAVGDIAANALLKRAEDVFDLAREQQDLAGQQRAGAEKQLENADKQQAIGEEQTLAADQADEKAEKLVELGNSLEADAAKVKGEMEVVQRNK